MQAFYSNGKLLITGEYVVLDGALSLAIPTKYGQSLKVEPIKERHIEWISFDKLNQVWYQGKFVLSDTQAVVPESHDRISAGLSNILNAAMVMNPGFLKNGKGFKVRTEMDFDRDWGLGSSSTLINNMAQWAEIDAFQLLERTIGGSGYDIACARYNTPILYQITDKGPTVKAVDFDPKFKSDLHFVHLNIKRDSQVAVKYYQQSGAVDQTIIDRISELTSAMVQAESLEDFSARVEEHERLISEILKRPTIKAELFSDFPGCIKSLGAWGGDFILVGSKSVVNPYFEEKGFKTIIPYQDMIL